MTVLYRIRRLVINIRKVVHEERLNSFCGTEINLPFLEVENSVLSSFSTIIAKAVDY